MSIKFVHVADVHLGYRQYGLDARENDFARAWLWVCDYVAASDADFMLISGDLFNSGNIGPLTLIQAVEGLKRLADIPVFVIEGNHDRARMVDKASWLWFLHRQQLLELLYTEVSSSGVSTVDQRYKDVQVIGIQYVGASTPKVLAMLDEALTYDPNVYRILMLHGGMEESCPFGANFKYEDLTALRRKINYVALGHIHQFYSADEWVYNPGSTESCSVEEYEKERFILHVKVDDNFDTRVTKVEVPCREFWRPSVDLSSCTHPREVNSAIVECMDESGGEGPIYLLALQPPVIELTLQGVLQFPRTVLDIEDMKRVVAGHTEALAVRINNKTTFVESGVSFDAESSRAEIEQRALADCFDADARYSDRTEKWVAATVEAKDMSLTGSEAKDIADKIGEVISC